MTADPFSHLFYQAEIGWLWDLNPETQGLVVGFDLCFFSGKPVITYQMCFTSINRLRLKNTK